VRFEELLGEFARLGAGSTALTTRAAVGLLRELAARTAFEPATDDVPVTVTAHCEDPIVQYDGIWVAGLTADAWPPPMRPDPLIPWSLQRAAGMPQATPDAALRRAEQAMQRWRGATRALALSFAESEADLPREPSPLLLELGSAAGDPPGAGAPFAIDAWLAARAPALEIWRDARGPAWPSSRALRGGTSLLQWQAQCPFRGFALARLDASLLQEPQPGIDPRVRGRILHEALERFWRALPDSAALHALGGPAAIARLHECLRQSVEQAQQRAAQLLDPRLLSQEQARDARLLEQLLAWELAREPFAIEAVEQRSALALGAAPLAIRLDRIDRLADGRTIVLDYKSGQLERFDAMADRLMQPQLPAYALAAGGPVAAVATVGIGRAGIEVRGAADGPGRLAGLRASRQPVPEWPALIAHWRERLTELIGEILRGHAAVDPQPGVCQSCHLQALCRIRAEQAPSAGEAEEPEEPGEPERAA